jgi:hypothetical protein
MKHCSKCGSDYLETNSYCPYCGAPFRTSQDIPIQNSLSSTQNNLHYTYNNQTSLSQQYINVPAKQKDFTSLGGWLLFFIVVAIIGVIANLGLTFDSLIGMPSIFNMWDNVDLQAVIVLYLFSFIFYLISLPFEIIYIVLIMNHKPNFLRFFQISRFL